MLGKLIKNIPGWVWTMLVFVSVPVFVVVFGEEPRAYSINLIKTITNNAQLWAIWLLEFPNFLLPLALYPVLLIFLWLIDLLCALGLRISKAEVKTVSEQQSSPLFSSNTLRRTFTKARSGLLTILWSVLFVYPILCIFLVGGLWSAYQGFSLEKHVFVVSQSSNENDAGASLRRAAIDVSEIIEEIVPQIEFSTFDLGTIEEANPSTGISTNAFGSDPERILVTDQTNLSDADTSKLQLFSKVITFSVLDPQFSSTTRLITIGLDFGKQSSLIVRELRAKKSTLQRVVLVRGDSKYGRSYCDILEKALFPLNLRTELSSFQDFFETNFEATVSGPNASDAIVLCTNFAETETVLLGLLEKEFSGTVYGPGVMTDQRLWAISNGAFSTLSPSVLTENALQNEIYGGKLGPGDYLGWLAFATILHEVSEEVGGPLKTRIRDRLENFVSDVKKGPQGQIFVVPSYIWGLN